jgi:hypothetical protein
MAAASGNGEQLQGIKGEVLPRMSPRDLEQLPCQDLRNVLDIDTDAYHGPTHFQLWRRVENRGVFPFSDRLALTEPDHFEGKSPSGAPIAWHTRYPRETGNPVDRDLTGFVDRHPYPHSPNPGESADAYWDDLLKYQLRVREEMRFHLANALRVSDLHPEYGVPVFPLAFNGAKPVGHILTNEFGVSPDQLLTAQVKRIPLRDGGLVIAAGGIQLPRAVHEGKPVFKVVGDDCQATWATSILNGELLDLAGANTEAQFFTAVVGTKHPIRDLFLNADIPTVVSVSAVCADLAANGYLLTPGGAMMVGDMGLIVNRARPGGDLLHAGWGAGMLAESLYV